MKGTLAAPSRTGFHSFSRLRGRSYAAAPIVRPHELRKPRPETPSKGGFNRNWQGSLGASRGFFVTSHRSSLTSRRRTYGRGFNSLRLHPRFAERSDLPCATGESAIIDGSSCVKAHAPLTRWVHGITGADRLRQRVARERERQTITDTKVIPLFAPRLQAAA